MFPYSKSKLVTEFQLQLAPSHSPSDANPNAPVLLIRPLRRLRVQARIRHGRPKVELFFSSSPRMSVVDLLKDRSNGNVCVDEGRVGWRVGEEGDVPDDGSGGRLSLDVEGKEREEK